MTNDQIFEKVREAFVEALGLEDDEVTRESTVFEDLGAGIPRSSRDCVSA